jgi:molybdate transport system substrate-binding protein
MMSQRPCTGRERLLIHRFVLLMALFLVVVVVSPRAADPVRVLAAVTLKPALDAIAEKYSGGEVLLVYGPSPTLAKQIENGVPANIFFSADTIWMDELTQHHLIKPETTIDLVGNHLVLIAAKGSGHRVTIAPGFPLAKLVGAGPLAMCDPDSHPAGRYGKASLVTLGVWQTVENKIARAENPLLAVKMVARGDVPFAIVFGNRWRQLTKESRSSGSSPTTRTPRSSIPSLFLPRATTPMPSSSSTI